MDASLAVKSLSSQVVTKSNGLKTKTNESPSAAFGIILQSTVGQGNETSLISNFEQKQGIDLQTLKQQLTQVITELNQEKPPLSADHTQLKGLLEQLLKNLGGQAGESKTALKALTPLLKNLSEALGKKQQATEEGSQDSLWSQLLSAVQTMIPQSQSLPQKDSSEGMSTESALKTTVLSNAMQKANGPLMAVSSGIKEPSVLANKKLQPLLLQTKETNQSDPSLSVKEGQSVDTGVTSKTPRVTKITSLTQLMPDKPKSDESSGKSGVDLSAMLVGGRPMNKVQQFLFHQSNTAQPELSPSDQIANQIKAWMTQGALKSSNGQLSINLNLHPDNLGSVQLAITQTDGGLTASITAHSSITKDLIDSQLTHLQQVLTESGIPVNKLDVNLAQTQAGNSEQSYQPPQDQGRGRQPDQQPSNQQEQTNENLEFETWLKEGMN